MPAKKEVSLLPDAENPNSFGSRLLLWLTSVGRFIIVFTELIVICAFISRFWLDRKNSDLSEIVRQQKAILESTQDFEKEYSLLQQRLKVIKNFYTQRPDYSAKIISLTESTPPDIIFTSINFDLDDKSNITADLSATALNNETINRFINNLVSNPDIRTVDVKNIEKKAKENKYLLNIFLTFKIQNPKT